MLLPEQEQRISVQERAGSREAAGRTTSRSFLSSHIRRKATASIVDCKLVPANEVSGYRIPVPLLSALSLLPLLWSREQKPLHSSPALLLPAPHILRPFPRRRQGSFSLSCPMHSMPTGLHGRERNAPKKTTDCWLLAVVCEAFPLSPLQLLAPFRRRRERLTEDLLFLSFFP